MKNILLFSLSVCFSGTLFAQASACPDVFAAPDTSLCGTGGCVDLTATVQGSNATTTYAVSAIPYSPYAFSGGNQILINIDDVWSSVIPMPFCFDFFGQTYNSCLIGSNAIITFDLSQANAYCQWPINAAIPSNQNPMNSIMAPFHDIDPSVGVTANIDWQVYGTAPCRQFVVNWSFVPMFSCNSMSATSQMVLHETTNIIDVYIQDKPICTNWNAGAAILGIQDATGSTAFVASNYNFPTQWAATNEGWRFMPSGAPNWTFAWFDLSGNQLSTSLTYQVCPNVTTSYVAVVNNMSCAGPLLVQDTVTVGVSPGTVATTSTSTPDVCSNNSGTATTNPTGTGPFTYLWQPGGGTTQTITGLGAGTYIVTVLDGAGCATMDTVIVINTNPPINPVIVTNAVNGQMSQAGPGAPIDICFSTSSPASIGTWNWVFNASQNSNLAAPCFTVNDTGTFCVLLAVSDTNGCLDTATVCVLVTSEAIFSFPNVFTPNGDGSNDLFLATTVGVKDLKVLIFDRWGAQIYEWYASDPNVNTTGWNGKTTKGKEVVDGVYYWVATVTDFQSESQIVSGFVHLIRGTP
ncbi:MAG TPA: gliding motility-associated C-terminal domain-containing protein [Bacteroidia bacterium]|nr:gliding motility-associated C-terminal domain-containing protein [Bacteroidia bacterium]